MNGQKKLQRGETVYRALPYLLNDRGYARTMDEGNTVSVETGKVVRSGETELTVEWRFGGSERLTHVAERLARTPYDALQTFEAAARAQVAYHQQQIAQLMRLADEAVTQCCEGAKMVGA